MLKRKMNSARRKPIAAILVIVAGLAITGGGYAAATAATSAKSETYTAAQEDSGHKLFLANCASCHGSNAQGTKAAPSLIGVGAASVAFQVGSGRMPAQASGPQLTDKPSQFTDQQITDLAAWVASLAPGPAVPDDKWLQANGNATRGGELFRINCAMCHNAVGAGGALTAGKWAPPLNGADPAELYVSTNQPADTNLPTLGRLLKGFSPGSSPSDSSLPSPYGSALNLTDLTRSIQIE